MAIETPKIEWFNGLSPIVRCETCIQWMRDDITSEIPNPCRGSCYVLACATYDSFYCKAFVLNQEIHVG